MADLKAQRYQLDAVLDVRDPRILLLANVILALMDEVETLQAQVQKLENADPESHLPEECRRHECSYYTHYLAYGGPDLTHEGYHQAEKNCERAQKQVEDWYAGHDYNRRLECPFEKQAAYWERAVRA